MMGFDPMSLKFIRIAHESGLGKGAVEEIEVVGEDILSITGALPSGTMPLPLWASSIWFGPLKPLQKLFFRTPLVYVFVFGSFFYHDFVYWP